MALSGQLGHTTIHQSSSNFSSDIVGQVEFVRVASRLSISPVSEEDVGQYWCQVLLENGTTIAEKSNVFKLSTEEDYAQFLACKGTNSVAQRDCVASENGEVDLSFPTATVLQSVPFFPTTMDITDTADINDTADITDTMDITDNSFFSTSSNPESETPNQSSTSGSTKVAYAISVAVLAVSTTAILLMLFTVLLRMNYCRHPESKSEEEVDPHYEEIETITGHEQQQQQQQQEHEYDDVVGSAKIGANQHQAEGPFQLTNSNTYS